MGTATYGRLARDLPGAAINATRAVVGLPVLVAALALSSGGPSGAVRAISALDRTALAYLGASAVASYVLGDMMFLTASRRLGVPVALAIASTYPFWATLVGMIWLGEPAGPARVAGVLLVIAGGAVVVLAAGPRTGDGFRGPRTLALGLGLAVLTAWFWALNSVGFRIGGAAFPATVTGVIRLLFALALCPVVGRLLASTRARVAGAPNPVLVPWARLRPVLWVFLLEAGGGTFFFAYGVSRSPLVLGAALTSLAPVLSLPIAWATGVERWAPVKALGILLVTGGVILLLA